MLAENLLELRFTLKKYEESKKALEDLGCEMEGREASSLFISDHSFISAHVFYIVYIFYMYNYLHILVFLYIYIHK